VLDPTTVDVRRVNAQDESMIVPCMLLILASCLAQLQCAEHLKEFGFHRALLGLAIDPDYRPELVTAIAAIPERLDKSYGSEGGLVLMLCRYADAELVALAIKHGVASRIPGLNAAIESGDAAVIEAAFSSHKEPLENSRANGYPVAQMAVLAAENCGLEEMRVLLDQPSLEGLGPHSFRRQLINNLLRHDQVKLVKLAEEIQFDDILRTDHYLRNDMLTGINPDLRRRAKEVFPLTIHSDKPPENMGAMAWAIVNACNGPKIASETKTSTTFKNEGIATVAEALLADCEDASRHGDHPEHAPINGAVEAAVRAGEQDIAPGLQSVRQDACCNLVAELEQNDIGSGDGLVRMPISDADERFAVLSRALEAGNPSFIIETLENLSAAEWCYMASGRGAFELFLKLDYQALLRIEDYTPLVDAATESGGTPLGAVLTARADLSLELEDAIWSDRLIYGSALGTIRDRLLTVGVDPNMPHNGKMPLAIAIEGEDGPSVRALVRAGADTRSVASWHRDNLQRHLER
jgi:hypothetical protein